MYIFGILKYVDNCGQCNRRSRPRGRPQECDKAHLKLTAPHDHCRKDSRSLRLSGASDGEDTCGQTDTLKYTNSTWNCTGVKRETVCLRTLEMVRSFICNFVTEFVTKAKWLNVNVTLYQLLFLIFCTVWQRYSKWDCNLSNHNQTKIRNWIGWLIRACV